MQGSPERIQSPRTPNPRGRPSTGAGGVLVSARRLYSQTRSEPRREPARVTVCPPQSSGGRPAAKVGEGRGTVVADRHVGRFGRRDVKRDGVRCWWRPPRRSLAREVSNPGRLYWAGQTGHGGRPATSTGERTHGADDARLGRRGPHRSRSGDSRATRHGRRAAVVWRRRRAHLRGEGQRPAGRDIATRSSGGVGKYNF